MIWTSMWVMAAIMLACGGVIGYCAESREIDNKHFWGAGIALMVAGFVASIRWGGPISCWDFIVNNALLVAGGAVLYLLIGVAWSFVKWYFYAHRRAENIRTQKEKFITDVCNRKLTFENRGIVVSAEQIKEMMVKREIPELLHQEFYQYLYRTLDNCNKSVLEQGVMALMPVALENKARVTLWIGYWPVSGIWTLLNDPLRRLVDMIFSRIKGTYARISGRIFNKLAKEFSI